MAKIITTTEDRQISVSAGFAGMRAHASTHEGTGADPITSLGNVDLTDGAQLTGGDFAATIDNQWLIGADADPADFPLARVVISRGDSGQTAPATIVGTVLEAVADDVGGYSCSALGAYGSTKGNKSGTGVSAYGRVNDPADTGTATGAFCLSTNTHTGGDNQGLVLSATGGTNNYALRMFYGDIESSFLDRDWFLKDDHGSALDFRAGIGGLSLLSFDTTNGSEKIDIGVSAAIAGGLAVWGATPPVAQPAKINDPAGGATVDSEARAAINAILDVLEGAGLVSAV